MLFLVKHNNEINALCQQHSVKKLYAFGSVLTDHFSDKSDVDLIVDFEHMDIRQYADNYFNLKFALESTLQRPIDLLEEKAIKNPYFKKNVEQQRQLIYAS